MSCNGGGIIEFWDVSKREKFPMEEIDEKESGGTYSIALDNSYDILASGGMDKKIRFYDLETKQIV